MASMLPLIDAVKKLQAEPSHARELRALFIAQVVGYQVPLTQQGSSDELADHYRPTLTKILNVRNNTIAIDQRLCQAYFTKVIQTRCQILRGVGDPVLLRYLVESQTHADNLPIAERHLAASLASRGDFDKAAAQALATVGEWFEEQGE